MGLWKNSKEPKQPKPPRMPKTNGTVEIVIDVVLFLIGIVLIVWPVDAAIIMTRVIGSIMVLLSIVEIIVFLRSKTKDPFEYAGLVISILFAGMGIWLIVNPDWLVQFFNIMFGIMIGLYGLFGIISAIGFARKAGGLWWIGLIMSIIAVALAVLIFMNPFATPKLLMIIIGVTLIVAAVTGVYNRLRIRKAQKIISSAFPDFVPPPVPDPSVLKDAGSDDDQ